MKLISTPKKILVPAVIIFFEIILVLLILTTQTRVIKNLRDTNQNLEKDNNDLRSKYLMLSSLDEEKMKINSAIAELSVPSEKNIPYILQAFRNAVEDADFLIKKFEFAPGEVISENNEGANMSNRVEELPLKAGLVGSKDNLDKLLESFENTLPLFEIKKVDFSNRSNEDGKSTVELELLTFFSPPLTKVQSEDITLDQIVLNEKETSLLEELEQFSRPVLKQREGSGLKRKSDNPFLF
jgi:hypothetical protein